MRTSIRQSQILQQTRLHGSCAVAELAVMFQVSEETIRRDIKSLEAEGLVSKVHGGVMTPNRLHEAPLQRRMEEHRDAKRRIAARLASIVENGDSLMMDTGSTTNYVAQALSQHQDLKVICNSTQIAGLLASGSSNTVYLSGGELRAHDAATFGSDTVNFFRRFESRLGILSVGAIHATRGITDYHLCEAELSQVIIENVEQVIVAADASKFDSTALAKVCSFTDIDILVTDKPPAEDLHSALLNADVEILLA